MARRKKDSQNNTKTEKTTEKEVKKRGRKKSFLTVLREKIGLKKDVRLVLNGILPEYPSFWCDSGSHFINMLSCLDRKFIQKVRRCTNCRLGAIKLEILLGDRVKEL